MSARSLGSENCYLKSNLGKRNWDNGFVIDIIGAESDPLREPEIEV